MSKSIARPGEAGRAGEGRRESEEKGGGSGANAGLRVARDRAADRPGADVGGGRTGGGGVECRRARDAGPDLVASGRRPGSSDGGADRQTVRGNLIISIRPASPSRRSPRSRSQNRVAVSGDPAEYVEKVHDAGGLLLQTVSSADEARQAVAARHRRHRGAGLGGRGACEEPIATLPLVPAVVDAVAPVPVIAAGGIGDARGVAAVFALGAQAAWLGTRFLLAKEMPTHEEYRRRVEHAVETDAEWYADLYDVGWPNTRPPRTPELDRRHVGDRGPAAVWEPPRRGRCARPLRLGRRDRPIRAGAPDGRHHRRDRSPLLVGRTERRGSSGRPSPCRYRGRARVVLCNRSHILPESRGAGESRRFRTAPLFRRGLGATDELSWCRGECDRSEAVDRLLL